MNDKEKMNNLEPIPGEPGWFVNPETGEVFNENDPSNYEEGEDGNYGDEEDWDDENDPYGEDLENDDESDGQESGEGEPNDKEEKESEEGEGGEGGSARDALKNSQEGAKDTAKGAEKAAESATNAGAKGAASAAEGVAGAGGAAAGSGAAASGAAAGGSAAAGGAAAAGGTAAAPWIAGAIAVVVVVVLLLLFFMALMGVGDKGSSRTTERTLISGTYGEKVVALARTQIGKPYEWAACRPWNTEAVRNGCATYDCSSLTGWAWYWGTNRKFKQEASTGAIKANMSNPTRYIHFTDEAKAMPGDLVFFRDADSGHIGIFVKPGIFIHAPRTNRDVVEEAYDTGRADFRGFLRPVVE